MFLFTFSWKEVKNSLIEGLFLSSEWSHGTQNSPLHSYAHSKSIAWSELTHFFFYSSPIHYIPTEVSLPLLFLVLPLFPLVQINFFSIFLKKKKEEDLLGISTEHA